MPQEQVSRRMHRPTLDTQDKAPSMTPAQRKFIKKTTQDLKGMKQALGNDFVVCFVGDV